MESPLQTIERLQQQVRDLEAQLAAAQQGVQHELFCIDRETLADIFSDAASVHPQKVSTDELLCYLQCYLREHEHKATHPTTQGLDADTQRNADIGAAIQRACKELPEGAGITISLERGAGMVEMIDWDGNEFDHFDQDHEDFACRINAAIDGAIAAEQVAAQVKQGEQA